MRERQNIFVEGRWKLESWREYEELKKMKKNKKKKKWLVTNWKNLKKRECI